MTVHLAPTFLHRLFIYSLTPHRLAPKFAHHCTSHLLLTLQFLIVSKQKLWALDFLYIFFLISLSLSQGYATLGHSVSHKNKNQNHFTPTIISPSIVLGGSSNAPLGVAIGNSVAAGSGSTSSNVGMVPSQMTVGLLSPTQAGTVTSSFSEYRFKPEVVTTSNRIQESCI